MNKRKAQEAFAAALPALRAAEKALDKVSRQHISSIKVGRCKLDPSLKATGFNI